MTSFSMTSLHVDLNDAAKCVDYYTTHIGILVASFSRLRKIQNGDDVWPYLRRFINQFMKIAGVKTWKELMTGVKQLVRLLFNNNFINSDSGLVL